MRCAQIVLFCLFFGGCQREDVGRKGSIVLEMEGTSASSPSKKGRVLAVLVGINTYKDKRFRRLQYAEKDALDMAAYLHDAGVKQQDIKVLIGKDATRSAVMQAVGKWLGQRASADDAVFVFLSTHGEKVDAGNYLVVQDSDAANLEYTGVSGEFIQSSLKRLRVRQQLVLLDSCFSRAIASSYVAQLSRKKSNFLPNTHGTIFRGRNRVVFMSSDGSEVSLEPESLGNGLYTHFFLKGLRGAADMDGDRCITAQEIQNYVADHVSEYARKLGQQQTPSWKPDIAGKGMLLVRLPGCGSVSSKPLGRAPVVSRQSVGESSHPLGEILVRVQVAGVELYVDGDLVTEVEGKEYRLKLPEGARLVEVRKNGFQPTQKRIRVFKGQTSKLTFSLVAQSVAQTPPLHHAPTQRASNPSDHSTQANPPVVSVPASSRPTVAAVASAPSVQVGSVDVPADASLLKAGQQRTFHFGSTHIATRWIPLGSFIMGAPPRDNMWYSRYRESGLVLSALDAPQRTVKLSGGYWMMETEVTQGQWFAVVGNNPSYFKGCGLSCPVETVSWHEAAMFANRLSEKEKRPLCFVCKEGLCNGVGDKNIDYLQCKGWRLPTEAEWEYAARAGTTTATYNTSSEYKIEGGRNAPNIDRIGWYGGNSAVVYRGGVDCVDWSGKQKRGRFCGTQIVGQKHPNLWGLHDMLGNTWEWVYDTYRWDAYTKLSELDLVYVEGVSPTQRVIRGGSWESLAFSVRSAMRGPLMDRRKGSVIGFRLVRSH